ncbi:MAG: carbohydrate ABC transporter permease [Oscillospiraceae bacterium]|nr:carbohydrate ABC transporter permease [Oscillospiraceae bacterium]
MMEGFPGRGKKLPNQSDRLRRKCSHYIFILFRTLFFIGIIYVLLFPLLVMVSRALRTAEDMYNPTVVWIPQHFTLDNFQEAAKLLNFSTSGVASGRIAVIGTILTMVSCSMAGYALGRFSMKGKGVMTGLAILTIVVPIQTYLIPLFFRFRFFDYFGGGQIISFFGGPSLAVSLVESELPYYILAVTGMGIRSGLFILVFSQFFRSMPKELDDAARIDGCGEVGTFTRIMLPNALAPYLVTFILSVVWYWNDTVYSSVMMQRQPLLSERLSNIRKLLLAAESGATRGDGTGETVVIFASAMLFVMPPLIFYLIAQKFFMQSVERSGIVG